jgi:hypothetical protein
MTARTVFAALTCLCLTFAACGGLEEETSSSQAMIEGCRPSLPPAGWQCSVRLDQLVADRQGMVGLVAPGSLLTIRATVEDPYTCKQRDLLVSVQAEGYVAERYGAEPNRFGLLATAPLRRGAALIRARTSDGECAGGDWVVEVR